MTRKANSAMDEPRMEFENAAAMGLSRDEWDLILDRLGRRPNLSRIRSHSSRERPIAAAFLNSIRGSSIVLSIALPAF